MFNTKECKTQFNPLKQIKNKNSWIPFQSEERKRNSTAHKAGLLSFQNGLHQFVKDSKYKKAIKQEFHEVENCNNPITSLSFPEFAEHTTVADCLCFKMGMRSGRCGGPEKVRLKQVRRKFNGFEPTNR